MSPRRSELVKELSYLGDHRTVVWVVANPLGIGSHLFTTHLPGGSNQRLSNSLGPRDAAGRQPLQRALCVGVEPDGNRLLGHRPITYHVCHTSLSSGRASPPRPG